MENQNNVSKASLWTGRVLKGLLVLFLLFDAIMKVVKHVQYVEGTKKLGLPESCVQPLGLYLLASTLLYAWSRTSTLGGMLLTAYLGGAVAITYQQMVDGHPYFFPIVFAALLWFAEYLMNRKVRTFIHIQPA